MPVLSPARGDRATAELLKEVKDIERFLDRYRKGLASDPDLAHAVGEAGRMSIQLAAMTEAFHRRFLGIALQLARRGELGLDPGELRFLEAYSAEMSQPVFSLDVFRKRLQPDAEAAAVLAQLEATSFKLSSLITRTVRGTEALRRAVDSDPEIEKMTGRLKDLASRLEEPAEAVARFFNDAIDREENAITSENLRKLKTLPDAITVQIDRRRQRIVAAAIRPAYEHSFVGALCNPVHGKASEPSAIPHLALSQALDEMLKSIKQRHSVLAGLMKRTTMLPSAAPETLSARMLKVDASLSVTRDPALLAWIERKPPAWRPPRITVSSGLIERLCESVDPAQEVHALARHLEQLAGRPAAISLRNYVNALSEGMSPASDEPDPGLLAIAITRKELAAELGAAFILAHELGHALFDEWEITDGESAGKRKMLAEVRADVFALLNADAGGIFGTLKKECNVSIQTGRLCHAEGQQLSELTAPYSFDEFLNLFLRTEFAEGDAEHPPVEQRFELLQRLYMAVFIEGKDPEGVFGRGESAAKQTEK